MISTVIIICILIWVLYVRWHNRRVDRRDERPRTDEEHSILQSRHMDNVIEEHFGTTDRDSRASQPRDSGGLIPLRTWKSRSSKQRVSDVPTHGPVPNEKQHRRDLRIDTSLSPLHHSLPSEQGATTPRKPLSARTIASSFDQRSVTSPLDWNSPRRTPVGPPLPYLPQTPTTPRSVYSPKAIATPRSASTPQMPNRSGSVSPLLPPVPNLNEVSRSLRREPSFGDTVRTYAADHRKQEEFFRSFKSPSIRGSGGFMRQ